MFICRVVSLRSNTWRICKSGDDVAYSAYRSLGAIITRISNAALMPYLSKAYIAWFSAECVDCKSGDFDQAMALSKGNSLYIAANLRCDAVDNVVGKPVIRVPGTIGKAGFYHPCSTPVSANERGRPGLYGCYQSPSI